MTEKRALPSHRSEFSTVDYWTEFYANRDAFEWYGDFHTLCEMIVKHIKKENEILMAGCGNSELSAHMFDQGWRRIVNVDFNPGIIKMMRSRHERSRPQMKWYCMDLSNLDLDPQSFDVVVDKGTLDAIFSHEENESQAAAYLHEMHRILRPGGRFLIVSLLQPFILRFLLRWFTEQSGYILGFTRLPSNSANSTAKNGLRAPNPTSKYVVFSVVAMKLKFPTPTAFRMCWTTTSSPQPLPSSADDVLRSVMELQALREIALPPANRTKGGDRSLEFFDTSSNHLRFVLHVVDLPRPPSARPMAVFLVPLGKERVWSYGTGDGRMDLAQTLDFDRLIVALPVRGQYYAGKEASMAELNAPLMDIARAFRPGIDVNASVCGNEGKVEQILPLVGKVFVSAVIGSDSFLYKRLVFKANPNIIQSEARFRPRASHLSPLGQEDLSPGEGGSTSTSCSTLSSMSDGGGTSAGNKKKKRKGARKGPVPREADGIQERIEAELMLPAEEQELDWNYINDTHHALMLLSLADFRGRASLSSASAEGASHASSPITSSRYEGFCLPPLHLR
ncbi:unnamed protein product [Cyprideis torosa]|uniref:Uncharacterized protein n=1 Tax=Cyprideis torosa TaxID=163714 RepID=A0A7R8ZNR8_9CRUS|nr:unnamed protein product [Cyprideis torosa]CAG0892207.1 unnamed protein product [Cyprideis torosa]